MEIWQLIQDQILGMKWLNELIGRGLAALGVDLSGRLGGSLQFFLYDVLKITVLLCCLIFLISYIQSYFPPERSKKILGHFHGMWANVISALLGTVTPFCSCSSIPLFMGFTSAGLPLGVTFSFLISSPMVDLGSLVLLMSILGAKVAVIYVALGLMIAVAGRGIHPHRQQGRHRISHFEQTRACAVRKRAGRLHLSKSVPLYSGWSRDRGDHPQLDSGRLGGNYSGE